MIPVTDEKNKSSEDQKICYICKKKISDDDDDDHDDYDEDNEKYQKVRDHCCYTGKYRGAVPKIYNLRYKTPKEIPILFHDENTEKYITFSVPVKKI